MTGLDRRAVLAALAFLVGSSAAAQTASTGIDEAGARAIGRAYIAAHPAFNARQARAELLPNGWSEASLRRLRGRVARDFRHARIFIHRGWRLSETEGRLFALTAS